MITFKLEITFGADLDDDTRAQIEAVNQIYLGVSNMASLQAGKSLDMKYQCTDDGKVSFSLSGEGGDPKQAADLISNTAAATMEMSEALAPS